MKTGSRVFVFVVLSLCTVACNDSISRNEDGIHQVIGERQLGKGHILKSYTIVNHIDSTRSLVVMVKGLVDSTVGFTDTVRFALTEDGFITK